MHDAGRGDPFFALFNFFAWKILPEKPTKKVKFWGGGGLFWLLFLIFGYIKKISDLDENIEESHNLT
jgi:hypothetical protein